MIYARRSIMKVSLYEYGFFHINMHIHPFHDCVITDTRGYSLCAISPDCSSSRLHSSSSSADKHTIPDSEHPKGTKQ